MPDQWIAFPIRFKRHKRGWRTHLVVHLWSQVDVTNTQETVKWHSSGCGGNYSDRSGTFRWIECVCLAWCAQGAARAMDVSALSSRRWRLCVCACHIVHLIAFWMRVGRGMEERGVLA